MIDKNFGCYGGRVLRAINTEQGKKIRGAILSPEYTSAIPIKNRIALSNSSKIEFFHEPVDADEPVVDLVPKKTLAEINQEKIMAIEEAEKAKISKPRAKRAKSKAKPKTRAKEL